MSSVIPLLSPEKAVSADAAPVEPSRAMTTSGAEAAPDQVAVLCQRLHEIAQQNGVATMQARQQEAEGIVADARRRAEAEAQAAIGQTRANLERKVERSLQIARLEARARIARHRWSELNSVLEAAADQIRQLRDREPARYTAALVRLLHRAVGQVSSLSMPDLLPDPAGWKPAPHVHDPLVVHTNRADISLVRHALAGNSASRAFRGGLRFTESDMDVGIVVSTPAGSLCVDESLSERLHRLNAELRLVAAEVLFE